MALPCPTGSTLTPSSHGLLTTLAHQLGPQATPCYALEGSVAVAGLGISWLRDNLRIIDNTAECEDIAKAVSVRAFPGSIGSDRAGVILFVESLLSHQKAKVESWQDATSQTVFQQAMLHL
jgi:hypothetical protein